MGHGPGLDSYSTYHLSTVTLEVHRGSKQSLSPSTGTKNMVPGTQHLQDLPLGLWSLGLAAFLPAEQTASNPTSNFLSQYILLLLKLDPVCFPSVAINRPLTSRSAPHFATYGDPKITPREACLLTGPAHLPEPRQISHSGKRSSVTENLTGFRGNLHQLSVLIKQVLYS